MNKDDLKQYWMEVNTDVERNSLSVIEETIRLKHCQVMSTVLKTQLLKIMVYAFSLLLFTGLMIYALIYLQLNLSLYSSGILTIAGLFLFFKSGSELRRLYLLKQTSDSTSMKDSVLHVQSMYRKTEKIDFIINLIFTYTLLIAGIIFVSTYDSGAVTYYASGASLFFIVTVLIILLLIPWFIRFIQQKHNIKTHTQLDGFIYDLEEEATLGESPFQT